MTQARCAAKALDAMGRNAFTVFGTIEHWYVWMNLERYDGDERKQFQLDCQKFFLKTWFKEVIELGSDHWKTCFSYPPINQDIWFCEVWLSIT